MAALTLADISVSYGVASSRSKRVAVDGLSLTLHDGEFVSLIGPSGCGKSTVLHCGGGMLRPTCGAVTLGGEQLTGPRPDKVAFVFQEYSLFPWKSVIENVGIGLRFGRVRKQDRDRRAHEQLQLMGLSEYASAYPSQLSGGMQQRVAVARGLAMNPDVLLLDEPFGALDEITRRRLGVEVASVLSQQAKTLLLVTHSLEEAIFWSDRVVVMSGSPGRILTEMKVEGDRPRKWSFVAGAEQRETQAALLEYLAPDNESAARI